MQFRRFGRQFFSITLVLEGRPQALSRLVEGAKRPELLPPGEVEALKRLKATPGTRFIKTLPCSLPPRSANARR